MGGREMVSEDREAHTPLARGRVPNTHIIYGRLPQVIL